MIDDAMRVRVVRSILGMDSKTFALKVGISAGTLTAWEKGRLTPQAGKRQKLARVCQEYKIAFLPSGYPVPAVDVLMFKEGHSA